MAKKIRQIDSREVYDQASIDNIQFNEASGAQKNIPGGLSLVPLNINATTWTTDASTRRTLPKKGTSLAIYNSDSSLHAVTLGDDSVTALASGAVSGNNAGIPVPAGQWVYLNSNEKTHVITEDSTLLVYIIEDESKITTS